MMWGKQLDLFPDHVEKWERPDTEPPQQFEVILSDPPWDYDGSSTTLPTKPVLHQTTTPQ